jgi:hypothetical protein
MRSEAPEFPHETGEVTAQDGFWEGLVGVLLESDPVALGGGPQIGRERTDQALDVRDSGIVPTLYREPAPTDELLVGVYVQGLRVLHARSPQPVKQSRKGDLDGLPTAAHEVPLVVLKQEGAPRAQGFAGRLQESRSPLGVDVLDGALGDNEVGEFTPEGGLDSVEFSAVASDDPHTGDRQSGCGRRLDAAVPNARTPGEEMRPIRPIARAEVEHETSRAEKGVRARHEEALWLLAHCPASIAEGLGR